MNDDLKNGVKALVNSVVPIEDEDDDEDELDLQAAKLMAEASFEWFENHPDEKAYFSVKNDGNDNLTVDITPYE